MLTEKERVRFFDKVDKIPGGCWEWTGAIGTTKWQGHAYGIVKLRRLGLCKGHTYRTHRVSWMIHNGPIPEGMSVLHKCDNPRCVNPEHLFLGTHRDNMTDMVSKGRSKSRPQHGSNNNRSKLTEKDVEKIAELLPTMNNKQIADAFEGRVSHSMVSLIRRGKSWTHVTGIEPRKKYESLKK